jgi:hypothetical protein
LLPNRAENIFLFRFLHDLPCPTVVERADKFAADLNRNAPLLHRNISA